MAKAKAITVAEWREYLKADWPAGWWVDDTSITVKNGADVFVVDSDIDFQSSGYDRFSPLATVKIVSGIVYTDEDGNSMTLRAHFKTWRTMTAAETLVIIVEKDRAAALKALLTDAGFKFQ